MLIEMTIEGLRIETVTNQPVITLLEKAGRRQLPIYVGMAEANAIAMQLENVDTPRPMTHDLLRNVIEDLEGRVERIVVTELKDNTFFALIHLLVRGETVTIDSRPSDAIALALRTRAPIFVEESVIEGARSIEGPATSRQDDERLHQWLESLDSDELGKYKM